MIRSRPTLGGLSPEGEDGGWCGGSTRGDNEIGFGYCLGKAIVPPSSLVARARELFQQIDEE